MNEKELHREVCDYLKHGTEDIIFNTDLSGIRLLPKVARDVKELRSSNAFPDIVIYEPRGDYSGLFIELKREGTRIYKKDGQLVADPHIREQAAMLEKLRERGYAAEFAIGYNEAIQIIKEYLFYE